VSTTTPIKFKGNVLLASGTALSAGTSGQIIDDGYNRIFQLSGGSSFSNVTQAGTTLVGIAPNLVLPHRVKAGLEMPRADLFGWSDAAHADQKFSASGLTTADFMGRTARPWGAGASIGCFQALNATQDATSVISGTNSLKIAGKGELSVFVPVDATSTTVSVKTESASYGGTDYAQMILVANPSIGVTTDTQTATDATEQTLTSGSFTPTAKGVVEVRLISRSSSGASSTYFDALTLPAGDGEFDHWLANRPVVGRASSAAGGLIRHPGMAGGLNA
jgi:hypothetical protein